MYTFFISAAPYIEDLLEAELQTLNPETLKRAHLGVMATGELDFAYRACLWSRLANRVLLLLDKKNINSADDLYTLCHDIDWLAHFDADATIWINFNGKSRFINNTLFGAQKVKDAIVDSIREKTNDRPTINKHHPDVTISVYLKNNEASVFIDLSGKSLHNRGFREKQGTAPIKETLAAAILYRLKWPMHCKDNRPLIDPFCGTGTILLEALMIAADIAPGLNRDYYGFERWKQHDSALWDTLVKEAQTRKTKGLSKPLPPMIGYDENKRIIGIAKDILRENDFTDKIQFQVRTISKLSIPQDIKQAGLIVTNPPYGQRLSQTSDLIFLYRNFGDKIKSDFAGWQVGMITSEPSLVKAMGLSPNKKYQFKNGDLDCQLYCFEVFTKRETSITTHQTKKSLSEGATMVANRILKNLKKLKPWLKTQDINCYRVYDADIPEYAAAIDYYDGALLIQEYAPPKTVDNEKAKQRFMEIILACESVFACNEKNIFTKQRSQQKKKNQYQRLNDAKKHIEVKEYQATFLVNLSDYLDSGLFLDHRPLRRMIADTIKNKSFLNLFCYTGSVSIQAALAGAKATTSVDLSPTYTAWAKENFRLNHLNLKNNAIVQADCFTWLDNNKQLFDVILLDPPTFSNSKRTENVLDIQRDHIKLIQLAMRALKPDGLLYFSNNYRRFKLDPSIEANYTVKNITKETIDPDFTRNEKIHQCWIITHRSQ